jgi:hypothetical protein
MSSIAKIRGGLAALFALAGTQAGAKIVCRDGFQVVGGREISTPYCNDNYIAAVAREHGRPVSDKAVRDNPSLRDEVCRHFGSDIRIKHYCHTNGDSDHDR